MVGRTWSRMVNLKFNNPKNPSEILTSNFWWNKIIHPWDVNFSKNKAIEFHGLGWVSMIDVWVVFARRFASKEEMGNKNCCPQKRNWDIKKSL
jgi:hypothetical protein